MIGSRIIEIYRYLHKSEAENTGVEVNIWLWFAGNCRYVMKSFNARHIASNSKILSLRIYLAQVLRWLRRTTSRLDSRLGRHRSRDELCRRSVSHMCVGVFPLLKRPGRLPAATTSPCSTTH